MKQYNQDLSEFVETWEIDRSREQLLKIAGVMFDGRQEALAHCREGDDVILRREHDNPADSNAIAVYHGNNQIGYVEWKGAAALSALMDQGEGFSANIHRLTGGKMGMAKGCIISVHFR